MMAISPPLFATVIHLPTGHVLAAVSSAGLEPALEDLTAAEHVRVRFPGKPGFVNVPLSVLATVRVAVTADMLDRPQYYVLGAGNPPLTLGLAPVIEEAVAAGDPGRQAIVVWQVGTKSIVSKGPLGTNGDLPGSPPSGATHRLVVYQEGPLHLNTLKVES